MGIDPYPKLNLASQCANAAPGIHGYCNNSTQIYKGDGASSYCKPPPKRPEDQLDVAEEVVKCCCEGCSPGACSASIDAFPKLSSSTQCMNAAPGIHGFCNNS